MGQKQIASVPFVYVVQDDTESGCHSTLAFGMYQ